MEMEVEISRDFKECFDRKHQQQWSGIEPDVIQTARFAGQEMTARIYSEGVYQLEYLGLTSTGFMSMDHAQLSAPAFAKSVLSLLGELIKEDPQ